ncbi:cytochrome P450 CYP12A2-like isoform X1 [Vanessa cardui]|uniref:cytochrome P450 CYP12A2-like isoform X1 n=2 Tax=Vanessa cardui TaxID=171605 RepID=UPI001F130D32|nr:cytochrome P450 CYP12A2-like isoform X1 [Vanessa cardui]
MYALRRFTFNLETICNVRSIATANSINYSNENNLKSWKEIPGPTSLPIIGQLLHFLPGGMLHDRNELQGVLYKKYGPIVKLDGTLGSSALIFLFEPEAAFHIFRNENWAPIRPGFLSLEYFKKHHSRKSDTAFEESTGLLTEHGETWRKFRSIVNPALLQPKSIKLYTDILTEVAEDMVKRLKSKRNDKNMIDGKFDMEMNLWALESVGVVALGGRLNCFNPNLTEDSPVKKLIQVVHDVMINAQKLDFQPSLWRYFSTPTFKKTMKHYEDQIQLNEYFINKAIENLKKRSESIHEEKGVLEKLLEIDHKVAVIMASDMLFAGIDTTANSVIATLFLLAKNPEKQKKLREEIMSKQEKQTYLKACIKEAMRLMPVVGGNFRQITKEYNVLGYTIPKDMFVIVGNQYMSLMEQYFPQPSEFIPERWIVDKDDPLYYGNAHPFAYRPFGFGVRSCIGRRIAELEIETFVSKVIESFHLEWFGPSLKVRSATINYLIGPYNFIFKDV